MTTTFIDGNVKMSKMELLKLLLISGYFFNFPIGAMFYVVFKKKWYEIFLLLIPYGTFIYYYKDLE